MRSANEAIGAFSSISMVLLYVVGGIAIGLFWLLRHHWVIGRTAIAWGVVVAFLQLLASLNDWPLLWMSYDTAVPRATFIAQEAASLIAAFVGFSMFFGLSFMAAESLSRRAFGDHPQLWHAWAPDAARSTAILGRTAAGYLFVTVFFAYDILLYFYATRLFGWWAPSDALIHPDVLASYFPWLSAIANSLQAGFWEESLFRAVPIAGAALIGDRFGKRNLFIVHGVRRAVDRLRRRPRAVSDAAVLLAPGRVDPAVDRFRPALSAARTAARHPVETWRASSKAALNRSVSKAALQLKFVLELETVTSAGDVQSCSAQLVWRYAPNVASCQLADDWQRLTRHPLLFCRAAREFSGAKARAKTVDLADVKTFVPAYDRDRGSFVPVYKPERDVAAQFRENLQRCSAQRFLSESTSTVLLERYDAFEDAYSKAIRGFTEHGSANIENLTQLAAYASLLDAVVSLAKGDRNRDLLLKPLLQIGVVPVDGGAPAAIIAPWNPFRLAAMWRKARLVAELVDRLLSADEVFFGDTRLFFRDLEHDLAHPLYPELAVVWNDDGPQLLAVSDIVQDYSLHEPPVSIDGGDDTNESPAEGSDCVLDLVRRYLALHPHERANMSVVLFNCDSSRLPQAVVDKMGSIHDDDEDVRCQVLLRHVDSQRLRDVYRGILSADTGADAYSASEATQDFMARLRISVVADQAPPPDPKDGCPYDIVFSQDVISRHARVEW